MPAMIRLGDPSDHGGRMVSASGKARIGGIQGCVSGDMHVCPLKGHGTTAVTSSSKCTSNGRSVVRVGDVAGCGAVLVSGSANTNSA